MEEGQKKITITLLQTCLQCFTFIGQSTFLEYSNFLLFFYLKYAVDIFRILQVRVCHCHFLRSYSSNGRAEECGVGMKFVKSMKHLVSSKWVKEDRFQDLFHLRILRVLFCFC